MFNLNMGTIQVFIIRIMKPALLPVSSRGNEDEVDADLALQENMCLLSPTSLKVFEQYSQGTLRK